MDSIYRKPFLTALGAAVLMRLFFVFVLPFGDQVGTLRLQGLNDEPAHFNYIRYLAASGRFPVQTQSVADPDALVRNEFEYYQPPLYYLLVAGPCRLFGQTAGLLLGRLLSFLFGLGVIWVVGRTVARMGYPLAVTEAAVLFVAFMPTHVYFSSVVSNDSLSWLLAALLTYEGVRAVVFQNRTFTAQRAAYVTLLLAGGLLTKTSLLLFYPFLAGACLIRYLRSRSRLNLVVPLGTVVLSMALAAPWYLRNLHVYGSLTALEAGCGPPRLNLLEPSRFVAVVKYTLKTFWFPMQHVPPSRVAGLLGYFGAAVLAAIAAFCVYYYARKRPPRTADMLLGMLLAVNGAAFLRFNLVWPHAEGRFFLPSVTALSLMVGVAVQAIVGNRTSVWLIPAAVAAVTLWPYAYLLLV